MPTEVPRHFADEVIERVRGLRYPLCAGLDPHLDQIPPLFRRGSMAPGDPETADAVEQFLRRVIEHWRGRVAAVKPQIAFFERLGWRGLRVLERLVALARESGLLVVLDAKRGDVPSTAEAYAAAYLDPQAPLEADALTVNPYIGRDGLAPFLSRVERHGRGVFVLAKTSNPGSADYQDRDSGGRPLYEAVAASLQPDCERLAGPRTGWSSLGVVVGATQPGPAERIRELLPRALFLVPGYGAQGATAADTVRGFTRGPDGRLEGGLVVAARSLLYPPQSHTDNAARWETALISALDAAGADLADAILA